MNIISHGILAVTDWPISRLNRARADNKLSKLIGFSYTGTE